MFCGLFNQPSWWVFKLFYLYASFYFGYFKCRSDKPPCTHKLVLSSSRSSKHIDVFSCTEYLDIIFLKHYSYLHIHQQGVYFPIYKLTQMLSSYTAYQDVGISHIFRKLIISATCYLHFQLWTPPNCLLT